MKSQRWIFIPILFFSFLFLFQIGFAQYDIGKKDSSNPLYVDPASQDFSANPELLDRILATPHGYLRFINISFSNEVCRRFRDLLATAPSLNLHGDAHLEQYAITDLGRGLTDYDDSSTGPGILDLMRFGVSLKLICRAKNWTEYDEKLYDRFLLGYRNALNDPEISAPIPLVVKRIQSNFTIDREKYFQWIESIMEPMPEQERDSVIIAMQPYVETRLAEDAELNKDFFTILKMGYLHMGIGSALDLKYLVRIQAETDDPLDDVVLEVKEVRNLSEISCIQKTGTASDPLRIIRGQARIAYQPFHHLGYFRFRDKTFWVHSWVDNYKEISIDKSFNSPNDLAEVVYDIGVQLGKGHVKYIAYPFDLQLRRDQLKFVTDNETKIKQSLKELADLIIDAWGKFSNYYQK